MATQAFASFQRTVQKCPKCKDKSPKEIVSEPAREFRAGWFLILLLLGGFPLIIFPLWWRKTTRLRAHCAACGNVFKIDQA